MNIILCQKQQVETTEIVQITQCVCRNYLFSRAARVAVYSSALWSFLMKMTITIACTAIAVTITTPNTPPRAATATDDDDDDDPLLPHAGTVMTRILLMSN